MTYQQILIDFMQAKSDKLEPAKDKRRKSYFTEADAEALRKWSDKKAEKVFFRIRDYLRRSGHGLGQFSCPFCIIHLNTYQCGICKYGKNHKICNSDGSTFEYFIQKRRDEVLNVTFYIDQLKSMNKKVRRIK